MQNMILVEPSLTQNDVFKQAVQGRKRAQAVSEPAHSVSHSDKLEDEIKNPLDKALFNMAGLVGRG